MRKDTNKNPIKSTIIVQQIVLFADTVVGRNYISKRFKHIFGITVFEFPFFTSVIIVVNYLAVVDFNYE